MWRETLIFFFMPLYTMHHPTLMPPTEIVISDEMGVVERIPMGQAAIERDLAQWMIKELMESNKELKEQVKSAKTKWYVCAAGFVTTFVPLVVCSIELYNTTRSCD
jgi:hypothetical protein